MSDNKAEQLQRLLANLETALKAGNKEEAAAIRRRLRDFGRQAGPPAARAETRLPAGQTRR